MVDFDLPDLPGLDRLGISRKVDIAVTGLRRSGKTVFMTSLVHNLLRAPRRPEVLPLLHAAQDGRLQSAVLLPVSKGPWVPFPYEKTLESLLSDDPDWPPSTGQVSRLELKLTFKTTGLWSRVPLTDRGSLRLGIMDYPGEWLVDLPLLLTSYEAWAADSIRRLRQAPRNQVAGEYLETIAQVDPHALSNQDVLHRIISSYSTMLRRCRDELDLSYLQPGRILEPGPDREGEGQSLPLFAPLDLGGHQIKTGSLGGLMRQRFGLYLSTVVKPFFVETFQRARRHVILVDLIGALHGGELIYADRREAIEAVMTLFGHAEAKRMGRVLFPRNFERVLFAATKADKLPHRRRRELQALFDWMVDRQANEAREEGAVEQTVVLSSVRCTQDDVTDWRGVNYDVVVGRDAANDERVQITHKAIPDKHPPASYWADLPTFPTLAPPSKMDLSGPGLPHINLDTSLQFLIGDQLE